MLELLYAAFSPVNIALTVLLVLIVLYWLAVIVGALDIHFLHVDVDAGGDVHVDLHADADAGADLHLDHDLDVGHDLHVDQDADVGHDVHADGGFHAGGLRAVLGFFYLGEVPLMVLVSILVLAMWMMSIIANHVLNPGGSLLLGVPIFAGVLAAGLAVLKVVGLPLRKLFSAFNKEYNAPQTIMGRLCTVTTTSVSDRVGQAEIRGPGAPIVLSVKTEDGATLHRGDEAVVVDLDRAKGVYVIAPVEMEKSS